MQLFLKKLEQSQSHGTTCCSQNERECLLPKYALAKERMFKVKIQDQEWAERQKLKKKAFNEEKGGESRPEWQLITCSYNLNLDPVSRKI